MKFDLKSMEWVKTCPTWSWNEREHEEDSQADTQNQWYCRETNKTLQW